MKEASLTASAIIRFATNLEDSSSEFYERLANKYINEADSFWSFSKQSGNNKMLISRTYAETITDALEACFSFGGIKLPEIPSQEVNEHTSFKEDLSKAINLESISVSFYSNIGKSSGSLLSTIARSLEKVGQQREKRKKRLESMLSLST